MNYILNEKNYIEQVLAGDIAASAISKQTCIKYLAYYNHHALGLTKPENIQQIKTDMARLYPDFWHVSYDILIDKYVTAAKKKKLNEIEYIPITAAELNHIGKLNNNVLEKLAFTMLVFAKYNNTINPQNSDWTSCSYKDLFTASNISGSFNEKLLYIRKLYVSDYIGVSANGCSENLQLNFVDHTDATPALKITDFRSLGYQYLRWKGQKKDGIFKECKDCNVCYKAKTANQQYCPSCQNKRLAKESTNIRTCEDCGKEFLVIHGNSRQKKCAKCYSAFRREYLKTHNE